MEISDRLNTLISPKSIAVIGASSTRGSVGWAVFSNILYGGYQGVVYPVNPFSKSILSIRCYPSILDVKDEVELAIIIVRPDLVPQMLDQCGKVGVKCTAVISAGFKEIGAKGAALEEEVVKTAKKNNICLLGPNCFGIFNTAPSVSLNATFAKGMTKNGNIAFISQSGALGIAAIEYARSEGIGLSKFISVGNKAGITENELLLFLKEDPETKVILLYLEDIANHKDFINIAREITTEQRFPKPIIAIKSGRTREGAKAASSHTGSLAGSDIAYDSVFDQSGVIRVETMEELFNNAIAFANQPLPRGNRLGIITNGGGAGIMATDIAIKHRLKLAVFDEKTVDRMRNALPETASVHNPVDLLGDATEERYSIALRSVLDDPNVDGLIVITVPLLMTEMKKIAEAIVEIVPQYSKPVLVSLVEFGNIQDAIALLNSYRIPQYRFPESAAKAMAAMTHYSSWVHRPRSEIVSFSDVDMATAKKVIERALAEKRNFLPEPESNEILRCYNLPVLTGKSGRDVSECLKIAGEIGYPVALKIVSPKIIHKVDVGGVKLNVSSDEELVVAYDSLIKSVSSKVENSDIWGVYVQKMAKNGVELIVGMKRDPRFGPMIMVGSGGTYVEAFQDVSFRLAPICSLTARYMIEQIKSYKILKGFRGSPQSDIEKVEEILKRISQLSLDLEEITELDINPLLVYQEGSGAAVVDARIVL